MSALSAGVARIGASLDLDTVLNEVVDGAGARYGAIATVDDRGDPRASSPPASPPRSAAR